jgi:RNA polymerase sigma-70 factor (ECF subfamily)
MLEKFVEEYADEAFHFAYSLCGDVEQSKELVQEAFFRLIKTWDSYDQSQRLDNWYLAILRNLYFDGRKKYEKRVVCSLDVPPDNCEGKDAASYADVIADSRDMDMLERIERERSSQIVREAIDGLRENYKAILTLCDIQGLGYEEIAVVLDAPLNTVRSRLFRAREALRAALREKFSAVGEEYEV